MKENGKKRTSKIGGTPSFGYVFVMKLYARSRVTAQLGSPYARAGNMEN